MVDIRKHPGFLAYWGSSKAPEKKPVEKVTVVEKGKTTPVIAVSEEADKS